ncbi:MAG: nitrogenase-stabilizing/protective protein NifW [Pseudomonadota bacterium]
MDDLDQKLSKLSAAEEFFDALEIPYEPAVVHVNRLHILKRFQQYLRKEGRGEGLDAEARFVHYQGLLIRAYADFVNSTPAEEKVFKVFQDAGGGKSISLDLIKASLGERRPTSQN